ncbi:uncharacterized protein F5891DRAFT_1056460 [Suillus fuscotomentosus]|uniref:Uncharacterized protein n=1 Tax=Suillus fuscotomentosus TaxID=1912939 RepID=A0AAD4HGN1_9AGAM|nr:uncharacterized protein F5891DRAFT_1056460 [Suillus fuscotomentosus]KAG1895873.1 hypothetical protein F5891DRAFT_1056460 [Suillus fuscotomentosus]
MSTLILVYFCSLSSLNCRSHKILESQYWLTLPSPCEFCCSLARPKISGKQIMSSKCVFTAFFQLSYRSKTQRLYRPSYSC